jgi:hypothetical protein
MKTKILTIDPVEGAGESSLRFLGEADLKILIESSKDIFLSVNRGDWEPENIYKKTVLPSFFGMYCYLKC